MRRLIYTKKWKVELWSLGTYNAYIYGRVYFIKHLFFKPYFKIKITAPFIHRPFYDGEYACNRKLKTLAESCRIELEIVEEKFKRRLKRL